MSKMAELAYDIEQLYIDGLSAKRIAQELNCDLKLVVDWIREQGIKPFDEWSDSAQHRLINDIVAFEPQEDLSPFNTLNS